jgi:hypothetical protein
VLAGIGDHVEILTFHGLAYRLLPISWQRVAADGDDGSSARTRKLRCGIIAGRPRR